MMKLILVVAAITCNVVATEKSKNIVFYMVYLNFKHELRVKKRRSIAIHC
jgi:hypothetical protein